MSGSPPYEVRGGLLPLERREEATAPPRVFVVSRHALTGYLVQSVLRRDRSIEVVGGGRPDHALLAQVSAVHPRVIVVEASDRPDEDVGLLTNLRRGYPQGRILMLGAVPQARQLLFARLGVAACLPERVDLEGLGKAIHIVSAGGVFFCGDPPQPANPDGDGIWSRKRPFSALTRRETEVLREVAAGWEDQQIGQRLKMAQSTVRMHLRSVFRKLGVRNRAHAVVVAAATGSLDNYRTPVGHL